MEGKHAVSKLILQLAILTFLLFATANTAIAQDNSSREKVITVDTNNVTGHLKYLEEYYVVNSSGKLVLDKRRLFFNSSINKSKVRFKIIRPLTDDGKMYPENQIKAIATINNKTIINSWYKTEQSNTPVKTEEPNKSPGFELLLSIFVIAAAFVYKRKV